MRRGPSCPCPGRPIQTCHKLTQIIFYFLLVYDGHPLNSPLKKKNSSLLRAFRGKHITLVVRFPNQGRQVDDLDIWSHTNDTIGSVRRCILNRIKANSTHTKIELFIGGEIIDPADDRKLIGQLNLKDKTVGIYLAIYSIGHFTHTTFLSYI